MNPYTSRFLAFASLLTAPALALAQDDAPSETTSEESAPPPSRSHSALAVGLRSHSLSVEATTPEAPAVVVDLEHPLMPHLTVFGGFHLGMGMNAAGLQAGSRLYIGNQPFQGLFLGLQAEGTFFKRDERTSGSRTSVGGLLGYSQSLGEKWRVSLGAGADVSQTRSETVEPPTPGCILFTPCLLTQGETRVEKREAVRPLVRLAAIYRF
ncbi:DUF3575 domain-containing protein [Archangium violaceum]|uniref:DUF3575 domain-containing protein n=1 Tax=Archangium violaceum TaxID=83451 RepID=UPI00193C33D1|nr:DUF3575 domain-containing protein [Archangium violaceum]QRK06182.1 DUF3575 domain-containing protein [Archangium violaceum]